MRPGKRERAALRLERAARRAAKARSQLVTGPAIRLMWDNLWPKGKPRLNPTWTSQKGVKPAPVIIRQA